MNSDESNVNQDLLRDLLRAQAELEILQKPEVKQLLQAYEENRVQQPQLVPQLEDQLQQLENQAYSDEFDRRLKLYEQQIPAQLKELMNASDVQEFIKGELADPSKKKEAVIAEAQEMLMPIVQQHIHKTIEREMGIWLERPQREDDRAKFVQQAINDMRSRLQPNLGDEARRWALNQPEISSRVEQRIDELLKQHNAGQIQQDHLQNTERLSELSLDQGKNSKKRKRETLPDPDIPKEHKRFLLDPNAPLNSKDLEKRLTHLATFSESPGELIKRWQKENVSAKERGVHSHKQPPEKKQEKMLSAKERLKIWKQKKDKMGASPPSSSAEATSSGQGARDENHNTILQRTGLGAYERVPATEDFAGRLVLRTDADTFLYHEYTYGQSGSWIPTDRILETTREQLTLAGRITAADAIHDDLTNNNRDTTGPFQSVKFKQAQEQAVNQGSPDQKPNIDPKGKGRSFP